MPAGPLSVPGGGVLALLASHHLQRKIAPLPGPSQEVYRESVPIIIYVRHRRHRPHPDRHHLDRSLPDRPGIFRRFIVISYFYAMLLIIFLAWFCDIVYKVFFKD